MVVAVRRHEQQFYGELRRGAAGGQVPDGLEPVTEPILASDSSVLAQHIDGVALIDQHVHGCWLTAGDRRRFENSLNEANTEPLAAFDSGFDTQLGFAVRAQLRSHPGIA